jgi:TolB-like protein/Tfp pilus assembly protein PilF
VHVPDQPVFISYASQDVSVADTIVEALERQGLKCWIAPRDVTPGASYAGQIIHAIDAAKASVLILSQNAASSPHVLREVERAASKRHPIISVRIDQAPLPADFEYFLSASHWLDTSARDAERALPRLVAAVRVALQAPAVMPAGVQAPHASAPGVSPRWRNRTAIIVASLVSLGLIGLAADRLWLSNRRAAARSPQTPAASVPVPATAAPAISDKSIAVLPFVDMSEKKDQEYFSDGLSEELIDLLAHIADLKVIARTSSFQFKGKNEDMRTIGQRLGVTNLLEGSVRTSGNTVRVTAQLIKVSDGSHRWSQTYDRDMRDIFKVQDAIATAVVTALKATMATGTQPVQAIGANTEAYKAVLRGRYFLEKQTKEDSERSIAAFQEAMRLDPNYAIAFAELGRAYNISGLNGWMPPKEVYAKAREAIDRAMKIDPQLALAHRVLSAIEWNYTRNFALARAEERRADALDPADPAVKRDAGVNALALGQPNEAVPLFRQLAEGDPLDASSREFVGWALFWADRLTEAETAFRGVLELNPSYAGARCALGEILLATRRPDAALAMAREETDEASRPICMADALWVLGRRAEAKALLTEAQAKYGDAHAYGIAESYALRDEKDEAFKWLDRAYENNEPEITLIRSDRSFRNLRADPRFTALLEKMHLL